MVRQNRVDTGASECGCVNFFDERRIVFLDEIEQVAERLGRNLVPGKLLACLVAFRPKKSFQKLHNILLFQTVFGFLRIADTMFVDGVAINARIRFDIFNEPLFVLCDFHQIVEKNHLARIVYGNRSLKFVKGGRVVFKRGFVFKNKRFSGEYIDDGDAINQLDPGLDQ
jgi:hypothetical protein